jgi:hypothetical protein
MPKLLITWFRTRLSDVRPAFNKTNWIKSGHHIDRGIAEVNGLGMGMEGAIAFSLGFT